MPTTRKRTKRRAAGTITPDMLAAYREINDLQSQPYNEERASKVMRLRSFINLSAGVRPWDIEGHRELGEKLKAADEHE